MRPDSLFNMMTGYLALLGIVSQVSSSLSHMIAAAALSLSTVILAKKANDENKPSLMVIGMSLNLLFLPILLQVLDSPIIKAALIVPASILQLEKYLELTSRTNSQTPDALKS